MTRSVVEVFEDHLARALIGDLEGDLAVNFAPDCVLLTSYGRFDGHDGVRAAAATLARQLPGGRIRYTNRLVHDDVAFLEWTAEAPGACVRDGTHTLIIRHGRIDVLTVHYTVATV